MVFHLYLWAVPAEFARYGLPLGHSSHQAAAVDYRLCPWEAQAAKEGF